MSYFTLSQSDPDMEVSPDGKVRFSPQGWRDYKRVCGRLGLTVTDDNKEWIENFRSGLHRWVMRLGAAGIFAMVGLQWESNQQLAETNKTLAVIEEKTNEVDKQQDVILSQQNSLERRMDRREEEAGRMSERLQVIERAHERTPHR